MREGLSRPSNFKREAIQVACWHVLGVAAKREAFLPLVSCLNPTVHAATYSEHVTDTCIYLYTHVLLPLLEHLFGIILGHTQGFPKSL